MHIPTKHEVETFSGLYVDTSNPQPSTIRLEDIAHALANTCRYGGHCARFYSVAEHAVFCSIRVERKGGSREDVLAALHHDDPEAYLGDIPTPIKPLLGDAYKYLTDMMEYAIVAGLNLPFAPEAFESAAVKAADEWALMVEARNLLPSKGLSWTTVRPGLNGQPQSVHVPDYWRGGITPEQAEGLYLSRHWEVVA